MTDALAAQRVPFRSQNHGDMWVLPSGGGPLLSLLRLVASPGDDTAFEAALDNDILLSSTGSTNTNTETDRTDTNTGIQSDTRPGAFDPHVIRDVREIKEVVLPILREVQREHSHIQSRGVRQGGQTQSQTGQSGDKMSLLEAARECVLTNRLPHRKYTGALKSFLLHVTRWADEAERSRGQGQGQPRSYAMYKSASPSSQGGGATKALVQDILGTCYAQRMDADLSRAVQVSDSKICLDLKGSIALIGWSIITL